MNSKSTRFGLIAMSLVVAAMISFGQDAKKPVGKTDPAENGLGGIKLYDTGVSVLKKFGPPDEIQPIGLNGNAAQGGLGPGGGGAAGGAGRPGAAGAAGGGAGGSSADAQSHFPGFDSGFDDSMFRQMGADGTGGGKGKGGGPAAGGMGMDPTGQNGPPAGGGRPNGAGAGPGGGPGAKGGAGGSGGASERVLYTRWVYNKGNTRYGLVVDNLNHIVQIEAIGLTNPKIRSARGISFGATFANVLEQYGAPDAYEISGENITVRYLVRDKVAFRLTRLEQNKPQRVTGIVVAAGKA